MRLCETTHFHYGRVIHYSPVTKRGAAVASIDRRFKDRTFIPDPRVPDAAPRLRQRIHAASSTRAMGGTPQQKSRRQLHVKEGSGPQPNPISPAPTTRHGDVVKHGMRNI